MPIRTATGKAGRPVRVGLDPGPLVVSPDSKTVYAGTLGYHSQTDNGNITVISAPADRIRRIIRVGADPLAMALSASGRTVYATTDNDRLISAPVSARGPGRAIRLAGYSPALALSPRDRTIYVLAGSTVMAVRARRLTAGWSAKIAGDPQNLVLAPAGRTVYVVSDPSASRPNYVTPVSAATGALRRRIPVGRYAYEMAFTPGGRALYVLSAPQHVSGQTLRFGIGSITPITTATGRAGRAIAVGRGPMALLAVR